MVTILFAVASIFVFRFRSRAALELKLLALQHQLAVLRRQRPGRPQLSSLDRLLWVLLYRIWPRIVDAMVLVKPATVVGWHRKGFRFYWRWQSRRRGRPRIGPEIRDLIRRMASRGIRGNIGNEDRGALLITPEPLPLDRLFHAPGDGRAKLLHPRDPLARWVFRVFSLYSKTSSPLWNR